VNIFLGLTLYSLIGIVLYTVYITYLSLVLEESDYDPPRYDEPMTNYLCYCNRGILLSIV